MDKNQSFINQDVTSSSEEEAAAYNCARYSGRIEEHFDSTEIIIPDKADESSDSSEFEIILNESICPNDPGASMDNPRENVAGDASDVQNEERVNKELAEAMVDLPKFTESKVKVTCNERQLINEHSPKKKISKDIEKQPNVTTEKLKESSLSCLTKASEMSSKCDTRKPSRKHGSVVETLKKSVSKMNEPGSTSGTRESGFKNPAGKLEGIVQNMQESQLKLNEPESNRRAREHGIKKPTGNLERVVRNLKAQAKLSESESFCRAEDYGINRPLEQTESGAQTLDEVQSKLNQMESSRAEECDLKKPSGELESVVQTLKEVQSILNKQDPISTGAGESTSKSGTLNTVVNEPIHQLWGNSICWKSVSEFSQATIYGDLLLTSDTGSTVTDETVQLDIPFRDNATTERETSHCPRNSEQITLEDLETAKENESFESNKESAYANETCDFNEEKD